MSRVVCYPQLAGPIPARSLSIGHMHSIASREPFGQLHLWGTDDSGTLGQGEGVWANRPIRVPTPIKVKTPVVQVGVRLFGGGCAGGCPAVLRRMCRWVSGFSAADVQVGVRSFCGGCAGLWASDVSVRAATWVRHAPRSGTGIVHVRGYAHPMDAGSVQSGAAVLASALRGSSQAVRGSSTGVRLPGWLAAPSCHWPLLPV